MKGFADFVKATWIIQNKHGLDDIEIASILRDISQRYQKKAALKTLEVERGDKVARN
ncbi:MAG: hypothetical protein ACOC80_13005 [Petrotogales bacterium]